MGMAWQTVNSFVQKYRLYRLLQSSVPVEDEQWQALLKEYRERFGIRRVTLSRNYGNFLADMEDNRVGDNAVSALCESRNMAVLRIRLLVNGKAKLMPGKYIFPACLILLVLCTAVLSHAASTYATDWSLVHMCATVEHEEVLEDQMIYDVSDESVIEKDLNLQFEDDSFQYEGTVEAQSRYFVFSAEMSEGARFGIMFNSEEGEDIRAGIKNLSTGELVCQESSWGGYNYVIPADGNYAIYIENIQEYDLKGYVSGRFYP